MRDLWYGDKRDIVKWGSILALACRYSIGTVFQIPFYRPYKLRINEVEKSLPHEVFEHFFRDLGDIKRLENKTGLTIDVLKDEFMPSLGRAAYFDLVNRTITKYKDCPIILLLDPDTGVAPKTCKPEHVSRREIQTVLKAMKSGDLLVFYQHKRQGDSRQWRDAMKEEFCSAVGGDCVDVIYCNDIAHDVVFFAVEVKKWSKEFTSGESVQAPDNERQSKATVTKDTIMNTERLTAREVKGRRVVCPACHRKVFEKWPMGWDSHAGFKCPGSPGDSKEEKQANFRQQFAYLFLS